MFHSLEKRSKFWGVNSRLRKRFCGACVPCTHSEMAVLSLLGAHIGKLNRSPLHVTTWSSQKIERRIPSRIKHSIEKVDMIVCRFSIDKVRKISRPCETCISLLKASCKVLVDKIYYFNEQGKLIVERLKNMSPGPISFGRRMMKENLDQSRPMRTKRWNEGKLE